MREAEGLLADMMADAELPRHLLSGLRAVSGLLKSTDVQLVDVDATGAFHRVRSSPVASVSDCAFASTAEYSDLSYAERHVYLPKVYSPSSTPYFITTKPIHLLIENKLTSEN